MQFNQQKRRALEFFEANPGSCLSHKIGNALGISLTNASDLLRRMWKKRLLEREKVTSHSPGRRAFTYTLTNEGLGRLAFYREKEVGR